MKCSLVCRQGFFNFIRNFPRHHTIRINGYIRRLFVIFLSVLQHLPYLCQFCLPAWQAGQKRPGAIIFQPLADCFRSFKYTTIPNFFNSSRFSGFTGIPPPVDNIPFQPVSINSCSRSASMLRNAASPSSAKIALMLFPARFAISSSVSRNFRSVTHSNDFDTLVLPDPI